MGIRGAHQDDEITEVDGIQVPGPWYSGLFKFALSGGTLFGLFIQTIYLVIWLVQLDSHVKQLQVLADERGRRIESLDATGSRGLQLLQQRVQQVSEEITALRLRDSELFKAISEVDATHHALTAKIEVLTHDIDYLRNGRQPSKMPP